jgi:nucleotide-binding universal stress UspA family protein
MTILIATDFSKPAFAAYRYAAALALRLKAQLVILNVLPTGMTLDPEYPVNALYLQQLHEEWKAEMEQLTRRVRQDRVVFEACQVPGDPSACIIDMADQVKAALIVTGTYGRTGFDRLLLGSTAEKVVRGAHCPVMTVRDSETESQPASGGLLPVSYFVVPIDFSDCAQEAFEFASSLAKPLGTRIRLIHAFEPSAYPLDFSLFDARDEKAFHARVRERLQELVSVLREQGISAEATCNVGLPADMILAEATRIPAAMIVMGTHGRRGWEHLAMGSVAEHVIRHSAAPVLTVKSPKYVTHLTKSAKEGAHAEKSH